MVTEETRGATRPMRADARQNYERLLAAASAAFVEHGPNVSLEEIASAAGVGIGTLYRHFPSRQALWEAVYRDSVMVFCGKAEELLDEPEPVGALITWLKAVLTFNLTKRGLKETLMAGEISPQTTECKAMMHHSGALLLTRAQGTGELRADIEISDLLRLIHGIAMMVEPGSEGFTRADRLFEVMVAGLRA